MTIVHPDFERRIELPGAGPCHRPVDIDRSLTGFGELVSLRVYSFVSGVTINGEAEADEVFIVLMRGATDIVVSSGGHATGSFSLRRDGGVRAIYMPPQASYCLTTTSDCDIAYARTSSSGGELPATRGFAPVANRLHVAGYAVGMELNLETFQAGTGVSLGEGGRLSERFVHIRSDGEMSATIAGAKVGDWDSVAIDAGECALLEVEAGAADILTISASQPGSD